MIRRPFIVSLGPEHRSWKTRGLHSCHSIHAWRNLGTSGDSSVMQAPTSVFYAYNVAAMQCNINALFGICFLRWKLLPSSKLTGHVRTPATWTDWIFFLSYRSRYLWIWFLTSSQSLYLSLHQFTLCNFTKSCAHYQRDVLKRVSHIFWTHTGHCYLKFFLMIP